MAIGSLDATGAGPVESPDELVPQADALRAPCRRTSAIRSRFSFNVGIVLLVAVENSAVEDARRRSAALECHRHSLEVFAKTASRSPSRSPA
jgi:hypothetical protein